MNKSSLHSFTKNHYGPSTPEVEAMLGSIGVKSVEELIEQTIPQSIRLDAEMNLPQPMTEHQYLSHITELSRFNHRYKNFIGQGYSDTFLPPVIQRNIFENPSWYTSYTPYQAEIAQGRLEGLLNFQTTVIELTKMEIANASLLDEATAVAEAMAMLHAFKHRSRKNAHVFLVSDKVYPHTVDVLQTRALPRGIEVEVSDEQTWDFSRGDVFGFVVQYPNGEGQIHDYATLVKDAKENHVLSCVAADILSLAILPPPGEWGTDVVVGSAQRFGIPLGYGGPHAAYFATREEYKRKVPGRIIGVSKDRDGKPALRMALQTREQHIRRDKATSNICTAQALLANMAAMYAVWHGPDGLNSIAHHIHSLAYKSYEGLTELGYEVNQEKPFFDTISVRVEDSLSQKIKSIAESHQMNLFYARGLVQISFGETHDVADVQNILNIFAQAKGVEYKGSVSEELETLPAITTIRRSDAYCQQPVFSLYHTETELMRYIKKLERKDISLNDSMISLGSCTMKLNSAAEMMALSDPLWNDIHPFAPIEQTEGYQAVIQSMETMLSEITGFHSTSLQPNSGAQGEFAGLMTIRAYHQARGDNDRDITLIPSSAHGTNPASAVMAGMRVVIVGCDEQGNIDTKDLFAKVDQYNERVAALMVTYPSTHGIFEVDIVKITDKIHSVGGQVYMDGANMNAQVGLTSPAKIGADVCHLNLHKTFAIPHGGGGPGIGPICVAEHLTPYIPSHVMFGDRAEGTSAISAAPWGSSLALLISYGYIRMLGAEGLKRSTELAILNTNYMKQRIEKEFTILYTGENGRVGHEMIIDINPYKSVGIAVSDVAKRLMDYGFHAPTVSFPVAGTMMIEPTESENKAELDRFCDALLSIKKEINRIGKEYTDTDNPLVNAPHTHLTLVAEDWQHPYSRTEAIFPLEWVKDNKFFPPVSRIDDAYGDRNLVCSCEGMEAYMEEEDAVPV